MIKIQKIQKKYSNFKVGDKVIFKHEEIPPLIRLLKKENDIFEIAKITTREYEKISYNEIEFKELTGYTWLEFRLLKF